MKILIFLIVLLFSSHAPANRFEVVGGSLSYHLIDVGASHFYDKKMTEDGRLIFTPLYGAKYIKDEDDCSYESISVFGASNSLGYPITGGFVAIGASHYGSSIGFVGGGYVQDNKNYYNREITPPSLGGDTNAFVPVVGIEINFRFAIGEHHYWSINNLLSPVITNHSISYGFNL